MNGKVLVDSDEFCSCLKQDLQSARDCIYLQTMSYEGDKAGKMVSGLLLSSGARDKRVIVDNFTKFKLSDRFLYFPKNLLDPELRLEVRETRHMFEDLQKGDVRVKFVNPFFGPLLVKFVARNHKKLIVIDDRVSYLGGINFSDHNFLWHDMMIRIEGPELAQFLKNDFLSTWGGQNQRKIGRFPGIDIHLLDGFSNQSDFQPILELIRRAEKSVWVISPYPTLPFFAGFKKLRQKGVAVTLITPQKNNKGIIGEYIRWESLRSGIDLKLYCPGMSHLKAMLIDDKFLLAGSANFDYLSYARQQEIVAVITDESLIASFKQKVLGFDLTNSIDVSSSASSWKGNLVNLIIKSLGRGVVLASRL